MKKSEKPRPTDEQILSYDNVPVYIAASYTGQGQSTLSFALQKGLAPFGYAVECEGCVTSPPYYNLRDYGTPGQIGMEDTPEEYIDSLVRVFREVRRVLRPDGTLWVNIGDSYATRSGPQPPTNTRNSTGHTEKHLPRGYKYKDLIGAPWLLAFALRTDGWYLRQDIIWSKPNCMPESVRDRCTKSHEYIFLLSKSEKYLLDRTPTAATARERQRPQPLGPSGRRWPGW